MDEAKSTDYHIGRFHATQSSVISPGGVELNNGNDVYCEIRTGKSAAVVGFDIPKHLKECMYKAKLRIYIEKTCNTSVRLDIYFNKNCYAGAIDIYRCPENTGWHEEDVTDALCYLFHNNKPVLFKVECESKQKDGNPIIIGTASSTGHRPELVVWYTKEDNGNDRFIPDPYYMSKLWLSYKKVYDKTLLMEYSKHIRNICQKASGYLVDTAVKELKTGIDSMLDMDCEIVFEPEAGSLVLLYEDSKKTQDIGNEGYLITNRTLNGFLVITIAAKTEKGLLYGAFALLRHLACNGRLEGIDISEKPYISHRMLNHWDNWDGTIERGYAGKSLWTPYDTDFSRLREYARACASIGINAVAVNNVNSQYDWIKSENLSFVARIAKTFSEYGMRIYISAAFDSPMRLGGINTADPCDDKVVLWWKDKTDEIYSLIPDFGGFIVKGDSEGQSGPLQYGKDHSIGANMLAGALKKHGGWVIWRAFVYNIKGLDKDRAKQAYQIFKPLDGKFDDNVILQIKNGPLDFQVREALSPLIAGMKKANIGIELQIAQEYTGHSTHLCWLVPQWKEIFDTCNAAGADMILAAGVANTGSDPNWTRNLLAQANWYGFGKMAWDCFADPQKIADEWVKMTFGENEFANDKIIKMLSSSWNTYEKYTAPLGLGYVCDRPRHFNPAPEARTAYNGTDLSGAGYDRTTDTGSGYTRQYNDDLCCRYDNIHSTPEELLLWFHHVPWGNKLKNGQKLIFYLYDSFFTGVRRVEEYINELEMMRYKIDDQAYHHIMKNLLMQRDEAVLWRNIMCRYFFGLSGVYRCDEFNDFLIRPTAYLIKAGIKKAEEIILAVSSKSGWLYLINTDRAKKGAYEKKRLLDLASDGVYGTSVIVNIPGEAVEITIPKEPGDYELYAVDAFGNVSLPSDSRLKVV